MQITLSRFITAFLLVLALSANQAQAVLITTVYGDGLTTGLWNGPQTATVEKVATVRAQIVCGADGGGSCWRAIIDQAYLFSYAETITLPQVGQIYRGGLFDQTFHDTTKTHENWHAAYIHALLNVTYGALETWSAGYFSNLFPSQAAALAAGVADLRRALQVAQDAFIADRNTDVTDPVFGHYDAVAALYMIDGVPTWRSENPDWGQAAVNYANGLTVAFSKTPGNCNCIPEPGVLALLLLALLVMFVISSRPRRNA